MSHHDSTGINCRARILGPSCATHPLPDICNTCSARLPIGLFKKCLTDIWRAWLRVQACNAAGGAEVLVSEMLPQLLPLFTCTATQRKLYGCSVPAAPDTRPGASTSLPAGESTSQSMHVRMRQALELASNSVPGGHVSGASPYSWSDFRLPSSASGTPGGNCTARLNDLPKNFEPVGYTDTWFACATPWTDWEVNGFHCLDE